LHNNGISNCSFPPTFNFNL